jgi:AhpD family alkylhydroperoxidase
MSMLDWNTYRQQLIVKVGEIAKLSPDTIKGYQALSAAGQKTDLLGAKTRELISLAVAVAIRCDGCITVHTKAAIDQGATREEIAEALGVATAINAGAGVVYSARVLDAYAQGDQPLNPLARKEYGSCAPSSTPCWPVSGPATA